MPGPSQRLLDTAAAAVDWCRDRPWPAFVAVVLITAGYAARTVVASRRHRRMARYAQLISISPPPEVDPDGTATFWATVAEIRHTGWRRRLPDGRPHIAVEYRWSGRELTIAVWVPRTIANGPIQAAIRGAWPGAACTLRPDGGFLVGSAVQAAAVDHPDHYLDDPSTIVAAGHLDIAQRTIAPAEVYAAILTAVRSEANRIAGHPVTAVALTVPAAGAGSAETSCPKRRREPASPTPSLSPRQQLSPPTSPRPPAQQSLNRGTS